MIEEMQNIIYNLHNNKCIEDCPLEEMLQSI